MMEEDKKPRKITRTLTDDICLTDTTLDKIIERLQNVLEEYGSTYENIRLEVDSYSEYDFSNVYYYFSISGQRLENEDELLSRIEREEMLEAKRKKEMLKQYENLKYIVEEVGIDDYIKSREWFGLSEKIMTYKELIEEIFSKFSTEQLNSDVAIYIPWEDEYFELDDILFADEENDVLDTEHPILYVRDYY